MTDATGDSEASDTAAGDTEVSQAETAYGCLVSWSGSQRVIHPARDVWRSVAAALQLDGWNMCIDVTAVDYLTHEAPRRLPEGIEPERFEVVAGFISHARRERIRARIQVPADDPTIASLYEIFPGADALEREVFDLMGITFDGHPDLSRIMMPEHWEGHPLRKDYATGAIPVQFKGAPSSR